MTKIIKVELILQRCCKKKQGAIFLARTVVHFIHCNTTVIIY